MKNAYLIIIISFMVFFQNQAGLAEPNDVAVAPAEDSTGIPLVQSIDESIQAIRQAQTPSDAMSAYSQGMKTEPNNAKLNQAYLERMVELEVPHAANYAAQQLVSVDPANGLAWGVLAYMEAERGNMPLALTNIVLAAKQTPDHPFILRSAGQLFAWYDSTANRPNLPETIQISLDSLKLAMGKAATYSEAYQQASEFYKKAAENAADEKMAESEESQTDTSSDEKNVVSVQAPSGRDVDDRQNAGSSTYGTAAETASSYTYNDYYYNTNYYYNEPYYEYSSYYEEPYYVRYWPSYYRHYYGTYYSSWPCYPAYNHITVIYLGFSGRNCTRWIHPNRHHRDHRDHYSGTYYHDTYRTARVPDHKPRVIIGREPDTRRVGISNDKKPKQYRINDIKTGRPRMDRSENRNRLAVESPRNQNQNRRYDTPRTLSRPNSQVRNERPVYNRQRPTYQQTRSYQRATPTLSNRVYRESAPSIRNSSRETTRINSPSRTRSDRSSRQMNTGSAQGSRSGSIRSQRSR